MLWFVCFFNYADRQAISSVLPLLQKEFDFSEVKLGWIGSAFAWVYAGAAPLAGLAADRLTRKRLLISACVVWSFFTLATAGAGGFTWLLAVRALTGLGETFYFPAAMALLSDYHSRQTRSRALAWHQSGVYAGTILGSWIAALLAERSGWRFPFLLFGPAGIVLAIVLSRWLNEPERGAADEGPAPERLSIFETVSVIFRSPAAMLLMGAFVCANFVAVIFLTWTPTFLVEKFQFKLGAAGLTGTLYIHLASAVAVPVAGILADRFILRWSWGRMLVQAIGLIAGAAFVFFVGKTISTVTLVFAMACFGICKGFYDSGIFASLYDIIEPRARGTAAGLMNTVGWAGGALGPLFVGLACKYGSKPSKVENMSDAISFGGVIYLCAAGLILAAMRLTAKRCRLSEPAPVLL
jgi:MFS family permease